MNIVRKTFGGFKLPELCFLGGYALYLAFGYMVFESSTVLSSSGAITVAAISLFAIVSLAGRAITYIATTFASIRYPNAGFAVLIVIAGALGLVGFLMMGMLLQFMGIASQDIALPWLGLSGVLLGSAAALGGLAWARFISSLGTRSTYLFVVLSNITSLPVYFVITMLPSWSHVPLCCALLIAAMAFVGPCVSARPSVPCTVGKDVLKNVAYRLWRPVLGTCVLAFMSGFMLQISLYHPIPLDVFQNTSLVTQFIVMVALLIPALIIKRPLALASVYKVALPLSALGFLLLPVIWTDAGGLANACAQLGYLVAGIIMWCMLSDLVRETHLPSMLLFSLAFCCIVLAQLAGALLGFVGRESLAPGHVVVTVIALSSIYAIAMVSMFLFKDRSFKGARREDASRNAPQSEAIASESTGSDTSSTTVKETRSALDVMRDCCDAIASRFHLTPREREILLYLGRGHTVSAIARELVVSENTVKFHIKGIYQKLDAHSRADVMALIDRESVS